MGSQGMGVATWRLWAVGSDLALLVMVDQKTPSD